MNAIRDTAIRCALSVAVVVAGATAGAQAASPAASEGLASLIAAERAFARHSERAGVKESFVANLGADGILFRPGPVNGLHWFRDRPAAPGYLSWEPEVAAIAASGDFGYTTGPWEFRAAGAADTVSGAGHYVTVWRRDTRGAWKVALDIGTSHRWVARPANAAGAVIGPGGSLGADARPQLLAHDSLLGTRGGPQRDLLPDAMAEGARLHRDGSLPALGVAAARTALAADGRPYRAMPLGGAVSRDASLGYTYGEYRLEAAGALPAEGGFYLRVWRHGDDGTWRILLELAQPVRPQG